MLSEVSVLNSEATQIGKGVLKKRKKKKNIHI